ncbi:hypothetical protein GCM10010080_04880 [Thermomonas carbonis]|uniref:PAAR domain-containing protein n=1 Tax=Thermomonas carbonis TaxID=1463158 RepID=A0A7G9SPW1_9GAMM|nr:PAAR domain-containing protein [Thermomonas carbonis]GHB96124.1 hypothetical protein GCM10010080_04880 [Thermomonas carbonis]
MLPAARVSDNHVCPMWSGVVPHVGGPVIPPCAPTVLIGFLPAARVTDMLVCAGGPDTIVSGSATVLINGLMAARMSDLTAHGGVIVMGCPTVLIGGPAPPAPPPPPPPPADMTPDEIAFMQAGNSPEDLERRRAEEG